MTKVIKTVNIATKATDFKFKKVSRNIEHVVVAFHSFALVCQMTIALYHIEERFSNNVTISDLKFDTKSIFSRFIKVALL